MSNFLHSVLQRHHRQVRERLSRHKKASVWLAEKGLSVKKLRERSAKLLTAGALSAGLLLNSGSVDVPKLSEFVGQAFAKTVSGEELKQSFVQSIQSLLPQTPRPLTAEEETVLAQMFNKYLNINALSILDGNHLNTTYGYTGEEQHLTRYPGDSIVNHDERQEIGMAPGLGAWGYFVPLKDAMTEDVVKMEKYYITAQTLYLPDWNTRQAYLKDWYKYRKVLVVNPKNGQAVVAVIGDAGPASWTGKQFGSSPELMHHLDLDRGMKKGEVVVFFVDDPENKVPLGPINYDTMIARI